MVVEVDEEEEEEGEVAEEEMAASAVARVGISPGSVLQGPAGDVSSLDLVQVYRKS